MLAQQIVVLRSVAVLLFASMLSAPALTAEISVVNAQEVRTVDLTSEGSTDWMHFGLVEDASLNRKAAVSALLGFTPISVAPKRFGPSDGTRSTHTWTDGTPTASEAGFAGGIYFLPEDSGYSVTAPADHHTRTLTLHLGGFNSSSQLQVSLSDSSATQVNVPMSGSGVYHHTVTIIYSADSSVATLTARHVKSGTTGNAAFQAATLTGPGPNQAPILASIGDRSVVANTPLSFGVSATDTDGPASLVLSVTGSSPSLPPQAVFTDLGDGEATFDWTPGDGDIGNYAVTFRAQDANGNGTFDEETITLSVTGNAAPVLDPVGNQTVTQDQLLELVVSATDPDGPAPLLLSISNSDPALPPAAVFTDQGSGSGTLSWTPTVGDVGQYNVTFRAAQENGAGQFDEETIILSVVPNQPPILAAIGDRSVVAANPLEFAVTATDNDGPLPLVLGIASSTPALPAGASFIDAGNGSGTFSWIPTAGDVGTYTVTFLAAEEGGLGQADTEAITITVNPNTPPLMDVIGDKDVDAGSELQFGIFATDTDGPAPLVMSLSNSTPALPGSATFFDASDGTGTFTWTPGPGDVGAYTLTFRAAEANGVGQEDTETITLTVNPAAGGTGQLTVTAPAVAPYTNNLTAQGTADWMHFGRFIASDINRKAGVSPQLAFAVLKGTLSRFGGTATTRLRQAWSDGVPLASEPGFLGGVNVTGADGSFQITAPADADLRTLKVHLGGNNSTGRLDVSINDGTTPPFSTTFGSSTIYSRDVTVAYKAASAGRTLTLTYTRTGSTGNIALQGASLAGAPPAFALPFSDDFNDGNRDGWSVVDDSTAASNWQVVNQQLHQLNPVESVGARVGTYQLGSYVQLAAAASLTNFRFSVSAAFIGTGLAEDVGVMFRYVDPNNYYRLSLNSRHGYTRLEKRVGGVFSTLAVNSRGYRVGEVLDIAIEARGSTQFAWINNDPVFAVTDASHTTGTVALYAKDATRFDNVVLTQPGSAPSIVLGSPLAFTAQSSTSLSATALANNVPSGGSVQFLLDGGSAVVDSTPPYATTFNNVSPGNHEVIAILRNSSAVEVARDTNAVVGSAGETMIAVGDSITNGIGDAYASDNTSVLERFIGFQGPQPNLITALDATRGFTPTLVFNEGIGGDETFDAAFARIDSIKERHQAGDRVLIGLGTNDAFVPVPSGLGCSGGICAGTFKGNLQTLVDKIIWTNYPTNTVPSNIAVSIALTPPTFTSNTPWTATANNLIRQYNQVITSEISGISLGPNLFDHFMPSSNTSTHLRSLFADTLHPNGLGYLVITALWHNTLEAASPMDLPFVLGALTSSVSSNKPQQDLIESGDRYRLNTAHVITSFPTEVASGRWIKSNNNTANASNSYLSFTVDRPVDVYIAYDGGATLRPNWMSSYTDTGLNVGTTDPAGPTMRLFKRSFLAGAVNLGGNKAAGSAGSNTTYIAIVVEN